MKPETQKLVEKSNRLGEILREMIDEQERRTSEYNKKYEALKAEYREAREAAYRAVMAESGIRPSLPV